MRIASVALTLAVVCAVAIATHEDSWNEAAEDVQAATEGPGRAPTYTMRRSEDPSMTLTHENEVMARNDGRGSGRFTEMIEVSSRAQTQKDKGTGEKSHTTIAPTPSPTAPPKGGSKDKKRIDKKELLKLARNIKKEAKQIKQMVKGSAKSSSTSSNKETLLKKKEKAKELLSQFAHEVAEEGRAAKKLTRFAHDVRSEGGSLKSKMKSITMRMEADERKLAQTHHFSEGRSREDAREEVQERDDSRDDSESRDEDDQEEKGQEEDEDDSQSEMSGDMDRSPRERGDSMDLLQIHEALDAVESENNQHTEELNLIQRSDTGEHLEFQFPWFKKPWHYVKDSAATKAEFRQLKAEVQGKIVKIQHKIAHGNVRSPPSSPYDLLSITTIIIIIIIVIIIIIITVMYIHAYT